MLGKHSTEAAKKSCAMDDIHDWPEPVVRVQSLSESGAAVIPDRYVKPPSQRPSSFDVIDAGDGFSIPVVDLRKLAEGPVECRAAIQEVAYACREWGFFQVINHGVSPDLIARARAMWKEFFHLPMEVKQAYANNPVTYEGYGSRLGVAKGASLDWGDYFYLQLRPESVRDHQKWPSLPASCRETIQEYGDEVVKLCELTMKVMSLGLGLDVDYLQEAFGGTSDAGACLRANYYPKCPQPDLTLGLSPHSDPGGLTVLLADDRVRGLQVRQGDAWVTVQPIPNAFIVNVGDQIQVVSNAIYKSVEHRVVVNAAEERISLALFYNPRSDIPLGPAAELVTPERPPLYRTMTYSEYRMYIRTKGPKGKSQLHSLKAT